MLESVIVLVGFLGCIYDKGEICLYLLLYLAYDIPVI